MLVAWIDARRLLRAAPQVVLDAANPMLTTPGSRSFGSTTIAWFPGSLPLRVPHHGHDPPARTIMKQLDAVDTTLKRLPVLRPT